jgi:lysophospholipase L1-like esterase
MTLCALNFTACDQTSCCSSDADSTSNQASPIDTSTTILAIGDSYFNFHSDIQQSIPDEIGKTLQLRIYNQSVSGAEISGGKQVIDIKDQYIHGNWDWVIMNGGGNDIHEKCACTTCENVLNELINLDGTEGEIPNLIDQMHLFGNKVVFMTYPQLPQDTTFGLGQCGDEFNELRSRINKLALNIDSFWLVNADDIIPAGDASFFLNDKTHPSGKATKAIGKYIAQKIQNNNSR